MYPTQLATIFHPSHTHDVRLCWASRNIRIFVFIVDQSVISYRTGQWTMQPQEKTPRRTFLPIEPYDVWKGEIYTSHCESKSNVFLDMWPKASNSAPRDRDAWKKRPKMYSTVKHPLSPKLVRDQSLHEDTSAGCDRDITRIKNIGDRFMLYLCFVTVSEKAGPQETPSWIDSKMEYEVTAVPETGGQSDAFEDIPKNAGTS